MKINLGLFLATIFCYSCLFAADVQKTIESTISQNSACKELGDFYWEIGTAEGTKYSGFVGKKYVASTPMKIASASKWLFGAYVYEVTKGQVSEEQKEYLQMRSGYTNLTNLSCVRKKIHTVKDCFLAKSSLKKIFGGDRSNAVQSSENKGKFYYNGGHAQALAVKDEFGLAGKTRDSLGPMIAQTLKLTNISYVIPQLAGGASTDAATYAKFLQNLITDKYYLGKILQSEKGVCANKTCDAKNFAESPVSESLLWWYGNHYWIEKNDKGVTLAYSSPGLFGFYPWISADKKYYGIIAREGHARDRGMTSISCGQAIRRALQIL